MADVRSLLRNERAARRIAHPAASYTESGKLLCNVCVVQIKTDSLWDSHIKSPQHITRLQQARDNPAQGKKRKAGDAEDEGRKRVKGVLDGFVEEDGAAADAAHGNSIDATGVDDISTENTASIRHDATLQPAAPLVSAAPDVDEAEWAAFERDIAATQALPVPISAAATITAAPMTAEQIAAEAREQQSTQRDRRQAEIEAEKEEAEQALLDEFDEMEELEDRVRRLREKREALRKARQADDEILPDVSDQPSGALPEPPNLADQDDDQEEEEEEEDDDDDEDDFDDWKFGAN